MVLYVLKTWSANKIDIYKPNTFSMWLTTEKQSDL